jgi:hypothetical protein
VSHVFRIEMIMQDALAVELTMAGLVVEVEDTLGQNRFAVQMHGIQVLDHLQPTGLDSFKPLVRSSSTGEEGKRAAAQASVFSVVQLSTKEEASCHSSHACSIAHASLLSVVH